MFSFAENRRFVTAFSIPFLGLPLACFSPLRAGAQNQAPDSAMLKTVVIQATRAAEGSPVPHNNLNQEQILQRYHAQDVPYLLASMPAVVETSDAGAGTGYTGLRIRGSDPTRVNVTINGVPLNDAESQIVYWVDLPDLAASATEIQVQRGVGTSTNGAGAFGGSINLNLSEIRSEPYARISNTLGAFNTRKHSASVGTGLLGGHFAFSGRFSSVHSDGYVDRATADLNAFHISGAYLDSRQSLLLHVLSGKEISYQAWYGLPAQYLEVDSLRTYNAAGTEKPGAPYEDQADNYTQRHYLLNYRRLLGQGLQLQLNGHYTRGAGYYEEYKAQQALADYFPELQLIDTVYPPTDLVRRRWLDNHFYGSTFALVWQPSVNPPGLQGPPRFTLGGALNRYDGAHFGEVIWAGSSPFPKDARYYDNDALKTDGNLYAQMQFNWRKGFQTFVDLQYRRVGYTFLGIDQNGADLRQKATLHFFNPKAGLRWNFRPVASIYLYYGIGHREPNRDDYTQSPPGQHPLPERLHDLEFGWSRNGAEFRSTINLYYMYYRNQLALDGRINDAGAYVRTNIPSSYRTGVEMEAQYRWGGRFDLQGNLCLSRNKAAEFTEYLDDWDNGGQVAVTHRNTELAFSPAVTGILEAGWNVLPDEERHGLRLALTGKYVGKQYLDNTSNEHARLDAFTYFNSTVQYRLKHTIGENLLFSFSVNNLLNARYASNGWVYRYISASYDDRPYNPYTRLENGAVYQQSGFFPQAGRHWMASLVLEF